MQPASADRSPRSSAPAMALLSAAFLILATKGLMLASFASPVPMWDTWDAELAHLYVPYLKGSFGWSDLFAAHNEHRIVLSRLIMLGLFELAGGWQPILAMMLNAFIHGVFIIAFARLMTKVAHAEDFYVVLAFSTIVLVIPIGFDSALMGMNAHFYLLLLLSFLAVTWLSASPVFSRQWIFGFIACLTASLTMASAPLAPLAALTIGIVQIIAKVRARSIREYVGCVLLAAATGAMLATSVQVEGHRQFRAANVGEFVGAFIQIASVPFVTIFFVLIVHLPIIWFAVRMLKIRPLLRSKEWAFLAFVIWIGAQMLALSYSRASSVVSLRYIDIVIALLPMNFTAALKWRDSVQVNNRRNWLLRFYLKMWGPVILTVVLIEGYFGPGEAFRQWKQNSDTGQLAISAFLAGDGGASILATGSTLYPDPNRIVQLLSDPVVSQILPPPMGPALGKADIIKNHTILRGRLASTVSAVPLLPKLWPVFGGLAGGLAFLAYLVQRRQIVRPA